MIRRAGYEGDITFECDDCGDELDTGEDEFSEALRMFRDFGWLSHKDGEEWSHYCKGCKRNHPR